MDYHPLGFRHGAEVTNNGVNYRLWSPGSSRVDVLIGASSSADTSPCARILSLSECAPGWYEGFDAEGRERDLYLIRLNGAKILPDPASRFQPRGVDGPSQ